MAANSWRNVSNVVGNEWRNALASPNTVLFATLLPVVILAQVFLVIWLVIQFAGSDALMNTILGKGLERFEAVMPAISALDLADKFKMFFYMQLPVYLLLIPAMIANGMATFSIVEEKLTGTLEPLLATPVRTWELLLGKALSGAVPAVIITWACAGLCLAGIAIIGPATLVRYTLTPAWLVTLLLNVPAITLSSFLVGVIGSSRARDAKGAQNLAVLIVLPILALVIVQLLGFVALTPLMLAGFGVFILLVDYLTLVAAVKLFRRESIVVKWK